jgi:hypothetical protein
LRRAVAAIWAQVRIWPAAAVWLAIAVVSLPFSHNLAPNVASTPDVASTSTFVPARLSTSAAPPADAPPAAPTRAPFLRIDLTLSPGHLNAIVTSSGMFTGVWSLEIDSGTQSDHVPVPETGRRHP